MIAYRAAIDYLQQFETFTKVLQLDLYRYRAHC